MLPSSNPSKYPSNQPSLSPTRLPSLQPSDQPFVKPTIQPSKQPSKQPISKPTRQPLVNPSALPSLQPSSQPSLQPFIFPTSLPTSSPMINGSACPLNTFYVFKQNLCKPCLKFSHTLKKGSLTCLCDDGYYQVGIGSTMQCNICGSGKYAVGSPQSCSLCPAGKFSPTSGVSNCTICPLGTYSSEGLTAPLKCGSGTYSLTNQANCSYCPSGTYSSGEGFSSCTPCPIGYYNSLEKQSSCLSCQIGAITPTIGSISSSACVVILPNFLIGTCTLLMIFVIYVYYIILGTFHKESFKRKERLVMPVAKACIQIGNKLQRSSNRHKNNVGEGHYGSSMFRFLLFVVLSIFSYIVVILITSFLILGKVFFNAFIIWKAIKFSIDLSFLDIMARYLGSIAKMFKIPYPVLYYLTYPLLYTFKILSSLNIDLSSISVTCEGSKAPIELFIDCFILGLVIVFITANYQLLWTITFPSLNIEYMSYLSEVSKNILKEPTFYICIVMTLINSFNPFQAILRFLMTYVVLGSFVADSGMHAVTTSCDAIKVFYPPSNIIINFDSREYTILIQSWGKHHLS